MTTSDIEVGASPSSNPDNTSNKHRQKWMLAIVVVVLVVVAIALGVGLGVGLRKEDSPGSSSSSASSSSSNTPPVPTPTSFPVATLNPTPTPTAINVLTPSPAGGPSLPTATTLPEPTSGPTATEMPTTRNSDDPVLMPVSTIPPMMTTVMPTMMPSTTTTSLSPTASPTTNALPSGPPTTFPQSATDRPSSVPSTFVPTFPPTTDRPSSLPSTMPPTLVELAFQYQVEEGFPGPCGVQLKCNETTFLDYGDTLFGIETFQESVLLDPTLECSFDIQDCIEWDFSVDRSLQVFYNGTLIHAADGLYGDTRVLFGNEKEARTQTLQRLSVQVVGGSSMSQWTLACEDGLQESSSANPGSSIYYFATTIGIVCQFDISGNGMDTYRVAGNSASYGFDYEDWIYLQGTTETSRVFRTRLRENQRRFMALEFLYQSLRGNEWANNNQWLSVNIDPCDGWFGIDCDDDDNLITSINLSNNRVRGSLPTEIELLSTEGLQRFDIWTTSSENFDILEGSLPSAIGALTLLTSMRIGADPSRNTGTSDWFVGTPLTTYIGRLVNLGTLSLASNGFAGMIPSELGNLQVLSSLDLRSNNFSGAAPNDLSALVNLRQLGLHDNLLSGDLTSVFCIGDQASQWAFFGSDCISEVTCDCCTACF